MPSFLCIFAGYMVEMKSILPGDAPFVRLNPPIEGQVLLHCCCAPCSSAILECLKLNEIPVTVFFSNSNIFPLAEYDIRRNELIRYCQMLDVEYVEDIYAHDDWLKQVAEGNESAPERGPRCLACFKYRLSRAAKYAAANGYSLLTTTLASSRWKSLEQINAAGTEAVSGLKHGSGLLWWDMNWRKGGLQPRRCELIKELGFYNQLYCGCEFSSK